MTPFHLAQLRHLYAQMSAGTISGAANIVSAAEGLLAPAIADEEQERRAREEAALHAVWRKDWDKRRA